MMVWSPARLRIRSRVSYDLLGVEPGGGFVENQNVRVVNDGLRQSDALPVAFGQFADEFCAHVGDGAAFGHFGDAVGQA